MPAIFGLDWIGLDQQKWTHVPLWVMAFLSCTC